MTIIASQQIKRVARGCAYAFLLGGMIASLGLGVVERLAYADSGNSCPYYDTPGSGTYQCNMSNICPAPNGINGAMADGCTCDLDNFCANADNQSN